MIALLSALIWCGAGAPVVQGFLTGLGVLAVGLVFFPFTFTIARPSAGAQARFARGSVAVRRGRVVAPVLLVLAAVTIVGYVVIFVDASGKFCGSHISGWAQYLVIAWSGALALTVIALIFAATLRRQAEQAAKQASQ